MREKKSYTIFIKLGTSSLCDEITREPKIANMSLIVETVVKLKRDGHKVVIVSSGAIAVGLRRIGLNRRPKRLSAVQAVAAIGQSRLIGLWDDLFRQLNQPIGQILLTRNDILDRTQYLNAANTIHELINMDVVPIINENDTLSVLEIRFGDNDTLSAITAGMINADFLFLMTDVDCLYTDNPRSNPDAKPIIVVDEISRLNVNTSSAGSSVGTGGMTTKLIAAELGSASGVTTIITRSSVPGNIKAIVDYIQSKESENIPFHRDIQPGTRPGTPDLEGNSGIANLNNFDNDIEDDLHKLLLSDEFDLVQQEELKEMKEKNVPLHTRFLPREHPIKDRCMWLLHCLTNHGSIIIDAGAYKALTRKDKAGLLPAGVIAVDGVFHESECVSLKVGYKDQKGKLDTTKKPIDVGRALVNYSSVAISQIAGEKSSKIESILGYADSEYIAHRDNLAFFSLTGTTAH